MFALLPDVIVKIISMKNFIEIFERRFLQIYQNSCKIIEKTPDEIIYKQLNKSAADFPFNSIGGNILRSAGAVEQAFGGITVRLWDDPFEWTLPEELKYRCENYRISKRNRSDQTARFFAFSNRRRFEKGNSRARKNENSV